MLLRKDQYPVFITIIVMLVAFFFRFIGDANYEFLAYIGVVFLLFIVMLISNKSVHWSNGSLWGLAIWAFMHLAGGGIVMFGDILYKWMIIDIVGAPYNILKYDQVVHMFGFYVCSLVIFEMMKPHIKQPIKKWTALSIVIVMASLGLGALNEIVELSAYVFIGNTGVGTYINNAIDLVADLIGAVLAMIWIYFRERKR